MVVRGRRSGINENTDTWMDNTQIHIGFEPDIGVVVVAALGFDGDAFPREPRVGGYCFAHHACGTLDLGCFSGASGLFPTGEDWLPLIVEPLLGEPVGAQGIKFTQRA